MTNKRIDNPIEVIVNDKLKTGIAYPTIVQISKVYNDGYCDVKNEDYGELRYIRSITNHNVGDITLLVFADNDYSKRIII